MGAFVTMTPALRTFTFTTHITSSAGWFGAVLVFLALAAIGLTSHDEPTVRGAYLLMAPAAWFVLVPLAHASLLSGIALSLGTTWGLARHYWVLLKLVITAISTVILMIYMGTFREMAKVAADPVVDLTAVRNVSPVIHAILALVLLMTATILAAYKPLGMTPYGRRKQGPLATPAIGRSISPRWIYLGAIVAIAILLVVLLHVSGTAFRH